MFEIVLDDKNFISKLFIHNFCHSFFIFLSAVILNRDDNRSMVLFFAKTIYILYNILKFNCRSESVSMGHNRTIRAIVSVDFNASNSHLEIFVVS